jgi:2-dehydro-3-deoxygluconokinase
MTTALRGAPGRLDVLTLGEAMVSFRSTGPFALGVPLTPGLAGAESNVAIGLARLGHTVSWVGRVGRDEWGRLLLRELRAEGVDTSHAVLDDVAPTGLMFLEQRTADVSRVDYRRAGSAGSRIAPADVQAALDMSPRLLHLTGITPALSDAALDAVTLAAERASAAGALVSLDVNFRSRLWTREQARAALGPLVRHTDLVIASDDELDVLAGGDEAAAVARLFQAGVGRVAIKRGAAGASLWTAAGRVDQQAFAVTAVDTVGAGDAFCAGLLSGLLDGLDAAGSLQRAATLGAFAVGTHGDWEGLPTRADLDQFLHHPPGTTVR